MKFSRSKTIATAVSLFLMLAMATSLIALPAVSAQGTWSIFISGRTSDWRIRGEVRFDNVRNQTTYTDIQLGVMIPGATTWTYLGPFSTSNGRVDHFYQGWTVAGTYTFQYIVPPQGALPTNDATIDGKWYSDTVDLEYTRPTRKTYPFINAVPNPVGVGQEVLLHIGITHPLQGALDKWEDLTVTVTDPDNSNTTLGPFSTDSTGGTGTAFVPEQTGTYKLQMHFPEQILLKSVTAGGGGASTPAGTVMLASDSTVLELIVQEEPIERHPGTPLPVEYWTRPIDSQLREWYPISGSDMEPGRASPRNFYLPYNDGPETAHILWTDTYTVGGLVGGGLGDPTLYEAESHSFELGDAYEGKWDDAITVAGRGYYRVGESSVASATGQPYRCVDLRTGEVLWEKTFLDNANIGGAQLMYWDTYDFHGVYDYLIVDSGGSWYFFDSATGNWHYTLENRPSSIAGFFGGLSNVKHGPKGELLYYNINLGGGWMAMWNSTNIPALYQSSTPGTMGFGQWRPFGKTVDAQGPVSGPGPNNPTGLNGYQWNVTIPDLPGSVRAILDDRIIGSTGATLTGADELTTWAISLKPGQEGQLIYIETWDTPSEWSDGGVVTPYEASTNYGENGVMVYGARELTKFYGFSTVNGSFLWETESQIASDPDAYLNWYGWTAFSERPTFVAYDKLIATGIGGIVYAYDIHTGELAWKYYAEDPYTEFLFNNNWWLFPLIVTDGKLYFGSLEHSPIDPRPRGAPFLALDAETGEEVFRVNGLFRQSLWGGEAVIGDSVILTQDTYDQRVYAIGKGPSALTVTAPDAGVAFGSSVVIRGTVTDISPGTRDIKLEMRFPNGVPAVADEYMSDWMLYVYKQFSRPLDATGVNVTLSVLDSNDNFYDIGTVTSDSDGFFYYAWTPDIPGEFKVYASFAGTEAYWPSHDVTVFTVEHAAEATPAPTPPASMTDVYVTGFGIGIIIAVVVVGLVIILVFRKR